MGRGSSSHYLSLLSNPKANLASQNTWLTEVPGKKDNNLYKSNYKRQNSVWPKEPLLRVTILSMHWTPKE